MAEREQLIQRALQERGIEVSGLKVRESGQVVGLWGSVASERDRERAERVVAETMRVKVRNHLAPRGDQAPAEEQSALESVEAVLSEGSGMFGGPMQSRRYIAKPGDTLEKVARQFYGDAAAWTRVREANPERLGDVADEGEVLKTGTELIVP